MVNLPEVIMGIQRSYLKRWHHTISGFDMFFFGSPKSLNDINILNHSPIFNNIYDGSAPDSSFQLHGTPYKYGYYLVDGIYREYAIFVKSFMCPNDTRQNKFKKAQERVRKDVERAFGALKKRWFILKKPTIFFNEEKNT
ncbi:uncharacterized protein LOC122195348 [Lactuca sativa]|uniref:uncharacterized protein LOC122195348 n=1 Tax=Lactuca sativa TaxID=4236 RepID=UPI001C68751A|nr:uncharacterized protein LOC122195348 [Lactuca sativa]